MACNSCKKTTTYEKIVDDYQKDKDAPKKSLLIKIRDYTIKIFAFILGSIIFVPLVIPLTFYVLYITIFTKKGINVVPLGLYIGKKLFRDKEEEDDEDDDFEDEDYDDLLDEDEYELEDSDEITVIK